MASKRPGQKITMTSIDELLCVPDTDGTLDIDVRAIYPFENHPFKVIDDERMDELVESIKEKGVLTPVLVRPDDEGTYEMISGHRRLHAAKRAGLRKIPAIVRNLTDDDATIIMVDANLQREEVLPSEKAFAYRMKLDAIKRQGYRRDLTSSTEWTKLNSEETSSEETKSDGTKYRSGDVVGKGEGIAKSMVHKYIRLTELINPLLKMVDEKRLAIAVGVELSYLNKNMQQWAYEYIRENGMVRQEQLMVLRNYRGDQVMNQEQFIDLMIGSAATFSTSKKITFTERKLKKYFPADYSKAQMERVIISLLTTWKQSQEDADNEQ